MSKLKEFLARKDIVISPQRYLIDALGAMAQGLFASLLIGTIIKTLGQQTGLEMLVDLGGYATAMSGPAMACAIGWALHCPPLVLFSLITVGYSANALGGAGGPLAVLIIAIAAVILLLLVGTVAAMASGFMAVNLFSAILIFPLTIAGVVLTYYDLYYIYKDYTPGNEVVLLVVSILCGAYPIIFLVVMNVVPVSVAGRCPYGQPKYNRPYQGPQDPGGQPPCGGPEYR